MQLIDFIPSALGDNSADFLCHHVSVKSQCKDDVYRRTIEIVHGARILRLTAVERFIMHT